MRLLFLFLPSILAINYQAPGMYPPEEMGTATGTAPPNPYGGDSEGPYLFYYEKDKPHPPGQTTSSGSSAGGSPSGGSHGERSSWKKKISSKELSGPVPPPREKGKSSGTKEGSWAKYIHVPSSPSSITDSVDPTSGYEPTGNSGRLPGKSSIAKFINDPSSGSKNDESDSPHSVNPYDHSNPSSNWIHSPSTGPKNGDSHDSIPPIDPYEHSSSSRGSSGSSSRKNSAHIPGSHPNSNSNTDSLAPIDPYEHSKNSRQGKGSKSSVITMSIRPREEITGGKSYRQDEFSLSNPNKFVPLTPQSFSDLNEINQEISKLKNLPVTEEIEEQYRPSKGKKPCCACCKEDSPNKEPVIGGGYIEATASQPIVPGPPPPPPPPPSSPSQLLNPNPLIQSGQAGYPPSPAISLGTSGYSQVPVQSYFTPVQSTPYNGGGGGGGGCGCAPQICCQPVQPCCLPSLPCCPPPPPIPCCPQISICCQPIVPCCLPQICLPTIPLCFRGCPSCPCRRRRSLDDPRHHSRVKRQSCTRRVKRDGSCRQCSNWNAITQAAGGCGTCNGSHRRVKRLGCLPCGRKKREALEEEAHIRKKRSCLPCLGGRKKREAPNGSCSKCSLLQTFITRHKRSFNCGPCGGRKKRSPSSSCSCASASGKTTLRMKRAVQEFDELGQCDRSCCDYTRCGGLKAKKLDLKN